MPPSRHPQFILGNIFYLRHGLVSATFSVRHCGRLPFARDSATMLGMKRVASRILFLALLAGVGSAIFAVAVNARGAGSAAMAAGNAAPPESRQDADRGAEVSFDFARRGGSASNQFAVWIEDAGGRYVRTLYATQWTARGGWRRREMSLPLWVGQSGLAGRSRAHVDAFAGATPRAGPVRFAWDGRDYAGQAVPAGEYRVFVEGSLRWENRVLYTAAIMLGEAGQASAAAEFFGPDVGDRGMLGPVTVTF